MDTTRRDIAFLLAAFTAPLAQAANNEVLPSGAFRFEDLPVRRDPKTKAEFRQVFTGTTHDGFPIDLHITTMPVGQMPHPPHHHLDEEMMLVQKGQLEVTISGQTKTVGPGSVIYVHSNDEHGLKCVGSETAQYFVLALGKKQA
jgi:mannose-6-phosphate isomerase-like protein (cupin superfamily)